MSEQNRDIATTSTAVSPSSPEEYGYGKAYQLSRANLEAFKKALPVLNIPGLRFQELLEWIASSIGAPCSEFQFSPVPVPEGQIEDQPKVVAAQTENTLAIYGIKYSPREQVLIGNPGRSLILADQLVMSPNQNQKMIENVIVFQAVEVQKLSS